MFFYRLPGSDPWIFPVPCDPPAGETCTGRGQAIPGPVGPGECEWWRVGGDQGLSCGGEEDGGEWRFGDDCLVAGRRISYCRGSYHSGC